MTVQQLRLSDEEHHGFRNQHPETKGGVANERNGKAPGQRSAMADHCCGGATAYGDGECGRYEVQR